MAKRAITCHYGFLPIYHHPGIGLGVPLHFNHVPHLYKIPDFKRQRPGTFGHNREPVNSLSIDSLPSCPIDRTCQ